MKTYIKPNTALFKAELTAILAGSPEAHEEMGGTQLSKDNDFHGFGDYDSDVDPTPQTFNVWED